MSRSQTCYRILHEAGIHSDKYGIAEGLLCLIIGLVYAAQEYCIAPRQLASSIKAVREMVKRGSLYAGENSGVAAVVVEMGLQ